jgi:ribosomal-protein-alanine N-acetyltransferase
MDVRAGSPADFPQIRIILDESPEASQWMPEDYPFLVAIRAGQVAGFLAWREIVPEEIEILNVAVARRFRRCGVASALLANLPKATVFLEVREGNSAARAFYRKAGFTEAGLRRAYYSHPTEGAIVMRLQS